MKILRAFKTKLVVNNSEAGYFNGCAGSARFVYNWGLAEWERQYAVGGKPSVYALKKQFNAIKDSQFSWVREYPYTIEQEAFAHLGNAFANYFRQKKDGTVAKRIAKMKNEGTWNARVAKLAKRGRTGYKSDPGYPQFKSRHDDAKFSVRGSITVDVDSIRLPVIGDVRLAEKGYLPTSDVKILSANVSREANDWYISLQVEMEVDDPARTTGEILGIDVGLKSLATCSDGTTFDNPRTLTEYDRKLKRVQRELSRRQKHSSNWYKTVDKLSRLHNKIAVIRAHTLHGVSRHVTTNTKPSVIVLEDLNVKGMMSNHHLAGALSDAGLSELHRQIEYKAGWNGIQIRKASQWYPSSKTCSRCGNVKGDLTLGDRTYKCDVCGLEIDRDLNAAINLAAYDEPVKRGELPVELSGGKTDTVKQEVGGEPSIRPAAVVEQSISPSYI